jgi:RNA polymerase sigma-70 factor (ECF subfamily)
MPAGLQTGDAEYESGGPTGRLRRELRPDDLNAHAPRLYRAAYGLCGSREDAEDLVQDTFERVLRRPRFLRRGEDLAYLMRVLRNTWISSGRSQRVRVVPMEADRVEAIPDPDGDRAARRLEAAAVYEALAELSLPLREALVAVDVLGLSYNEAARALDTKPGTIMSRLHRGRSQVAERLEAPAG